MTNIDTKFGVEANESQEPSRLAMNDRHACAGDELMRILEAAADAQEEQENVSTTESVEGYSEWESFIREKANAPIVRAKAAPPKAAKKLSIASMQAMRNRRVQKYYAKQSDNRE